MTEPSTGPFEKLEPKLDSVLDEFVGQVWEGAMDSATLEMCRVRMAMLLGSEEDAAFRSPQAAGGGASGEAESERQARDQGQAGTEGKAGAAELEAKLLALSEWPTSPLFTEADRAALDFCEKYVIDPYAITDEDCVEMNRCFSEPELTNLTFALAAFEGLIRSRVALAQVAL